MRSLGLLFLFHNANGCIDFPSAEFVASLDCRLQKTTFGLTKDDCYKLASTEGAEYFTYKHFLWHADLDSAKECNFFSGECINTRKDESSHSSCLSVECCASGDARTPRTPEDIAEDVTNPTTSSTAATTSSTAATTNSITTAPITTSAPITTEATTVASESTSEHNDPCVDSIRSDCGESITGPSESVSPGLDSNDSNTTSPPQAGIDDLDGVTFDPIDDTNSRVDGQPQYSLGVMIGIVGSIVVIAFLTAYCCIFRGGGANAETNHYNMKTTATSSTSADAPV